MKAAPAGRLDSLKIQFDSARGVACYTTSRSEGFACVRVAPDTVIIVPAKEKAKAESLKAILEDSLRLAQR